MAGITIADRLGTTGSRVCLLEAGGLDPEASTQRLFRGANVGRKYYSLDRCRHAVFGGSSTRWGGFCRPLDPEDFVQRDWIPLSGWPIAAHDLADHYAQAARLVELPRPSFDLADWEDVVSALPTTGAPDLTPCMIQLCPKYDFGEKLLPRFRQSANITTFLHAPVTEILMEPGTSRASGVMVRADAGAEFTVRATRLVLASGGIENARLLLGSRSSRPQGVGNESDFVGRCFMEHLHLPFGYVVPRDGFGLDPFFTMRSTGASRALGVLAPTAQALRERRLPSCSITFNAVPEVMRTAPMLGVGPRVHAAHRRFRRRRPGLDGRLRRAAFTASGLSQRAAVLLGAASAHPGDPFSLQTLYLRGEQVPNPASRVKLADRLDPLGLPAAQLDWRLHESDLRGLEAWSESLGESLRQSGRGDLVPACDGWQENIQGGPHHLGTTRMSSLPSLGVVDADCRVHTVDNLYIAGGSVFTTGGHANPSLTILALAIRLADHLRHVHERPAPRLSWTPTRRAGPRLTDNSSVRGSG
jgi:choline dehydrogenase-like flavoprotein